MSICDELKIQVEERLSEDIDKSIEAAAVCFRFCAKGLYRFSDGGKGSYPIEDISLLVICSAVSGGWNGASTADRERLAQRLKLYVSSVNGLCDDLPFSLTVPGYANIGRNLMSPPQITTFTEHLANLLKTLDDEEKTAVIAMHYLMLYAVFEQWPQVDVLEKAYELACRGKTEPTEPTEPSESRKATRGTANTYAAPAPVFTQSSPSLLSKYERNAKRRWRPLKVYLIVTGLFVALVLGLYFSAAPSFSEGQAIVVKDITGQSVKMLPESDPVDLAFVGKTDYNGVVRLFYATVTGAAVYRAVTIAAVFIINAVYRKINAKKAAALRAGNFTP